MPCKVHDKAVGVVQLHHDPVEPLNNFSFCRVLQQRDVIAHLPAEGFADRASVIHCTDQLRNAFVGVLVQADD